MKENDDISKLFHGQTINMDYFIMSELRDVDLSAGTPFYPARVDTLQRTVESNAKILNDPEYKKEMKDIFINVPDEKTEINNLRNPAWKQQPINTVKIVDYFKKDNILRKYLAKYNHTFKTYETEYL